MNETLYLQIQQFPASSFNQLYDLNKDTIVSKQELGNLLRELEADKRILFYKNSYYDLSPYPVVEGYAQWTMTGFCWLSDKEESNDYGITFDANKDLTAIYNKRDAFYGSKVTGKDITIDDHHFIYVTDSQPTKPIKVLAVFNDHWNQWTALNSNLNFSFKNKGGLGFPKNNEVCLFESADGKEFSFKEDLGNMSFFDMDRFIIQEIAHIKDSDISEFDIKPFLKKNLDITLDKPFYTIDSIHTKDIDDAIYIEKDGKDFILYVAIADVSAYIEKDSALDQRAFSMASSYYLPQKTVHMVNRELSEGLCSLNGGIPKRTMVCSMRITEDGEVIDSHFSEEVIMSSARLTYNDVDGLLKKEEATESTFYASREDIVESLNILEQFSQTQGKGHRSHEWLFDFPEYKLGENGKIDHLYLEGEEALSQRMVASAMLAANTATAKFLEESYPNLGLFRNQVAPLDGEKPTTATYSENNEGHWGLGVDFYTHFTSPIRRYCDLIVHRLLKGVLHQKKDNEYTDEKLQIIAKQINTKQYVAKQCESKAKQLLLPQYLEQLVQSHTFNEKLEVMDIQPSGLLCRNKQLIEIFIPVFKMDKELSLLIEDALTRLETDTLMDSRKKEIDLINKNWMLFAKIERYSWTDRNKEAYFSTIKRKVPKLTL